MVLQQPDLHQGEKIASGSAAQLSTRPASLWAARALLFFSGIAGLGYEIVWTEQLGLALGHENVAVLAVLAAFFAGLALGAWAIARALERSAWPARWYAACELAIALWTLLLSVCMPEATRALASVIGVAPTPLWHWSVAFLGPFMLLLPATLALGASLPALERAVAPSCADRSVVGGLYAANTAGSALGVLACAFVLIAQLGLAQTTRCLAAVNLACALGAWWQFRGQRVTPVRFAPEPRSLGISLRLWAAGLLAIGFEVAVVRVLSQVSENTLYTLAIVLGVYLLGAAIGGALHQRWVASRRPSAALRERILAGVSVACLCGSLTLWLAPRFKPQLMASFGGGFAGALLSEITLACAAFLLPTAAMAVLFSQLSSEAKRAGIGVGRALAVNTAGAALAPLLFGVWLLPALGAKWVLIGLGAAYLLLMRPSTWSLRPAPALAAASGALCCGLLLPPLIVVDVPAGGRLLRYDEGVSAAVSVIEDGLGVATLHINNRQQEGSSASLFADARQAWLPLLLHRADLDERAPQRVLFLGLGTGLTAGAAAWAPQLQVDVVELLPEVVRAAAVFAPVLESERQPHVYVSDARRYVRGATAHYDVIVADLFHPARSGSGALYTVEHFAAVRQRLAGSGLFCQWLPLHQLELTTLRSVVRSFLEVYPHATALLATGSLDTPVLGLLGTAEGADMDIDIASVREQIARLAEPGRLSQLHLDDEYAVLGSLISGASALQRFAADAPLNTEDRPVVAERAPLDTYAPSSSPRERLLSLLRVLSLDPGSVVTHDPSEPARLAAYWSARTRFLELGAQVHPSPDASAMLAQLSTPLLAILHESPDFRPAYDPLLSMAAALPEDAAGQARAVLAQLVAAQPARVEAAHLLQRLSHEENP